MQCNNDVLLLLRRLNFVYFSSTVVATGHFDLTPYTNVASWFDKVKGEVPNYEKACGKGATDFGGLFKMRTKN